MNTSDHYNLNLVEGTDIVNPLIVDVPNYEAIDAQMYENSCATIGMATELTSGSVHSITRANSDAPMFRFTATSNWTAGDTMTVDGIQVTVLLPTGETLGSGAYVINSTVLCSLVGTLVTVYGPSGTVSEADNAQRLGGNPPEYYGTAEAVTAAQETANAAGVLAGSANTTANRALDEAQKSELQLLWTNPAPSVAFAPQTVTVDLSEFDFIEIYFCESTSRTHYKSEMTLKNHSTRLTDMYLAASSCELYTRTVTAITDAGITFDDGITGKVTASNYARSTDNSKMIPEAIYGGKFA